VGRGNARRGNGKEGVRGGACGGERLVEAAQAEGQQWSKGTSGAVSGERRARVAHTEEMGRRASGATLMGEIETGLKGCRVYFFLLSHPKGSKGPHTRCDHYHASMIQQSNFFSRCG
jgi:hypothetical protein